MKFGDGRPDGCGWFHIKWCRHLTKSHLELKCVCAIVPEKKRLCPLAMTSVTCVVSTTWYSYYKL